MILSQALVTTPNVFIGRYGCGWVGGGYIPVLIFTFSISIHTTSM